MKFKKKIYFPLCRIQNMEGRLWRNQQLVVCQRQWSENAGLNYYCNRSGNFKTTSTGRRHLKSQGTFKLNTYCTAAITVKMTTDECLKVTIHKTHYGHRISLGHIHIPETDRLAIAGKLANGVDFQHILDNIRDKLGKSYQWIHLLTRKDITNIEKKNILFYWESETPRWCHKCTSLGGGYENTGGKTLF